MTDHSIQKKHIERLRYEFGVSSDGRVINTRAFTALENSLQIISSELNKDIAHFLHEVIQNADDLEYDNNTDPFLTFDYVDDHLLITSNELGFQPKHVEAICSVGESTKKNSADSIGEKGIGFKSLFKAATCVWICSNGYNFKFDRSLPCGIVIPTWTEFPPTLADLTQPDKTQFLLGFTTAKTAKDVLEELKSLDPKLLLFLRKLRKINVKIEGRVMHIRRIDSELYGGSFTTLSTETSNSKAIDEGFLIVRQTIAVSVLDDKRKGRTKTEVVLAFPTSPNLQNTRYAYNFLPICATNFPFLFNADFVLSATREDVDHAHRAWNNMLLNGLASAYVQAVLRFNKFETFRFSWVKYLPISPGTDAFSDLERCIHSALKDRPVLYSQGLNLCLATQAVFVPPHFRAVNGQPLLDETAGAQGNLSVSYSAADIASLKWLGVRELTPSRFLDLLRADIKSNNGSSFQQRPMVWHQRLAAALLDFPTYDVQDLEIIPLRFGEWSNARSHQIFFHQSKSRADGLSTIPAGLQDIRIVRDDVAVAANDPMRKLFKSLGVDEAGPREVCEVIKKAHSSRAAPTGDDAALISQVIYVFHACLLSVVPSESLSLWILDEQGQPCISRNMYQSRAQVSDSVVRHIRGTSSEHNLMHPSYLAHVKQPDREKWTSWLTKSLGCYNVLRFKVYFTDRLTPEFRACMSAESPQDFLEILTDAWTTNISSGIISTTFSNTIGELTKPWTGHDPLRLNQTILPTAQLKTILKTDVPFLNVPNADDKKWLKLEQVGVAATSNYTFWLACLQAYMRCTSLSASPNDVKRCYHELSRCCRTDPQPIKRFFDTKPAILITTSGGNVWASATHCVWASSVPVLRSKYVLSRHYQKELEPFFKANLNIGNLRIGDVTSELLSMRISTSDSDVAYLKGILVGLSNLLKYSGDKQNSLLGKLRTVTNTRSIPLYKVVNGEKQRQLVAMNDFRTEWFIADSTEYRDAFEAHAWLADFEPEDWVKLETLFKYLAEILKKPRPCLSEVVKVSYEHDGRSAACDSFTRLLQARGKYIGAIVTSVHNAQPVIKGKLARLEHVKVFSTAKITRKLSIKTARAAGGLITGKPLQSKAMLIDTPTELEVFVLTRHAKQNKPHSDLSEVLINHLGITQDKHKRLVDHILNADSHNEIRDRLVRARITFDVLNGVADEDMEEQVHAGTPSTPNHTPQSRPKTNGQSAAGGRPGNVKAPSASNTAAAKDIPVSLDAETREALRTTAEARVKAHPRALRSSQAQHTTYSNGAGPNMANSGTTLPSTPSVATDDSIGLRGEYWVYLYLKHRLGESFTADNWTSELREHADGSCGKWQRPDDTNFFADFTYQDTGSIFGQWLHQNGIVEADEWCHRTVTYHIEVKATTSGSKEPFHMSSSQFEAARRMSPVTREGTDVFILLRVLRLYGVEPELEIITDPYKHFLEQTMEFKPEGGYVVSA